MYITQKYHNNKFSKYKYLGNSQWVVLAELQNTASTDLHNFFIKKKNEKKKCWRLEKLTY